MADNRMAPISASEIAGGPGSGPVVTPQSTALMSDMFRQGVISVNDIVQGIDRHNAAKTQQAAADMALAEASAPDAVAAREAEVQLRGATARGALELQPLQQQATAVGLKSLVWGSKLRGFGINPESVVQLVQEGFNVPMDFNREPTAEDAAVIRTMLQQSADFHAGKARQKDLEKEMSSPQTFRSPDGQTVLSVPTFQGKEVSQSEFNQTMADFGGYVRAGDWVKAGARRPSLVFPGQPGTVTAPTSPAAPAAAPAATPAAPPVVPAQAAPSAAGPVVQPQGKAADDEPRVTAGPHGLTIHFPPKSGLRSPTESQQKSASALTRMVQGEAALDELSQRGFDPTSFSTWAQGLLPNWTGALKGEDVRAYQQAASNWVQGLLRLESGAAIAYKEQKWYENTFFPQVGDTMAVVNQKWQARQAMSQFLATNVGLLTSPEIQQKYQAERETLTKMVQSAKQGSPTPVGNSGWYMPPSAGSPTVAPMGPRRMNPPAAPAAAPTAPIKLKSGRQIKVVGRDANGLPLLDYAE